jgi:hypothetical protein
MAAPSNLTIQSLYPGIYNKFGGRSNLGPANSATSLYAMAAREAIQELTENNEFEELKVPSPIVTIQYGVLSYSISQFIPSTPASVAAAWDYTDVFDWGFWLNPGSTNGPFRILKQRRVPTVNQYQFGTTAPAPPIYFSRFGSPWGINGAGNELLIGPTPDNNYQSIMYFRVRHPFTATVYDSPIYMPDSWQEIIEYSACLRLAINEGAEKYAALFRGYLFGDPKDPRVPGLLKGRQMQMERDANHNERQISVATQLFSGVY